MKLGWAAVLAGSLWAIAPVCAIEALAPAPMPAPVDHEDVYFIVNKQANELSVFSLREPMKLIRKFRAISGANVGDKLFEGDKRTPEGIYFLERELPKSRLTSLHGAAAFELNYPNPYDRINSRTGSGIWIHGVDRETRMEKRFDTQGCVALGNKDVVELRQWVEHDHMTPVLIVDQVIPGTPLGIEGADGALGKRVQNWVEAWASKDVERYLAFYDAHFYARKMNLEAWTKYKRRLAKNYEKIEVSIRDLTLFRHGKYSVAVFFQTYRSNRYQSTGWKRLYLLGEGDKALILAEEMRNEVDGAPAPEVLPPAAQAGEWRASPSGGT